MQGEQLQTVPRDVETAPQEMIGPEYAQGIETAFPEIVQQIEEAFASMSPETQEALMAKPAGRKFGGPENKLQSF